jgi:hypothetical protein
MKTPLALVLSFALSHVICSAGLWDVLGLSKKDTNATSGVPAGLSSTLSQDQMVQGLKEALSKGVAQAINRLGTDGGFLTNLDVKIPMPERLQTVERTLRTLKQDAMADQFVATMNHAAEKAVPQAAGVFADAIKSLSIQDAQAILTGPTNAATQFFRRTTETNLYQRFLPIVKQSTDAAGVTAAYKKVIDAGSGSGTLGSFGRSLLGADSLDVDGYVTSKALDGLFKMVATEEARIRENPVARTTEMLQKVFGAIRK